VKDQRIDGCIMDSKQYRLVSGLLVRKDDTSKDGPEKMKKHLSKRIKNG